ncbi:MAG: GNAT family protein [Candidatus Nanopelagicales bacterium]
MHEVEVETPLGILLLRVIRHRDGREWRAVRLRNRDWLKNWDATTPPISPGPPPTFAAMVRGLRAETKAGRLIPWVLELDGQIIGQLTIGGITRGSLCSAHAGYWIAKDYAGRGIMTLALGAAIDYLFQQEGLHRVEVNIRPENASSKRIVEKLGLRYEGLRERYLHIDGDWRDHLSFAITHEEVPDGLLARYRAQQLVAEPPSPANLESEKEIVEHAPNSSV